MDFSGIKTLYIVGPTASGKTALALQLAQRIPVGIICADSRTIYRGLDIGTAKPSRAEQQLAPHYCLDVVEPGERYSVARFQTAANEAIEHIRSIGRLPIVVGGSGLYIDSLLFEYQFKPSKYTDEEIGRLSNDQLIGLLRQLSPGVDESILTRYANNRRHLESAVRSGGVNQNRLPEPVSGSVVIGINPGKEVLAERIERRAKLMFESGVFEEAEVAAGVFGWGAVAASGSIYTIANLLRQGKISTDEAFDRFVILDKQLAKRQLTWFRRNKSIEWHTAAESAYEQLIIKCTQRT